MSFNHRAGLIGSAWVAGIIAAQPAQAQQAPTLTLQSAFARALEADPGMRAADEAGKAADAAIRQADRRPNPSLDILAENVAGTGLYQSIDRAEATFSLSQRLELGGDRQARTRLAQRDAELVRLGSLSARQVLMYDIELAYIDAQRTAAEVEVAQTRLSLAEEMAATVEKRVEAARDPLMASARSRTLLADAQISLEKAKQADQGARGRLASFWQGGASFSVDPGSFASTTDGPETQGQANSPELARTRALQERADAVVDVERARAKLDPTVSGGVRLFNDTDEAALVVGVSIPLGLWDNNSAAIDRASAERQRAFHEGEALRRNLERETATARSQLAIARTEVEMLDARLLPFAEEAVARAREGYAQGGFSYLDVLDAQRVLAESRLQRISALYSYHRARAALNRLTGAYGAGQEIAR